LNLRKKVFYRLWKWIWNTMDTVTICKMSKIWK